MRALELLAPAKNLECGIAAIDHGADAVYIGASRFGARAAAGNSVDDIRRLCDYAHPFGVKVYVTVNTILFDNELESTRQLLQDLQQVGVDAILVQDMALLEMRNEELEMRNEDYSFPVLHASTQTDNRTPEKVRWLRDLGFSRVVLARELSVEEIATIHREVPDVELEVFVHGALCVSYSGICYASQYCFGRSANRGECAQFCRMKFSLVDAEGREVEHDRHLLSLKDMNQSDHLEELIEAGATSFKIEGRLKDVSYVKNVTAAYSQRLNQIIRRHPDQYCRSSQGVCRYTFTPDLNRTFNRGYTTYFLHGRQPDIASFDTPKAIGGFVGTVKEIRYDSFNVAGTASFANGDGLCFFNEERQLEGFRANRVVGNRIYPYRMPQGLRPGVRLFRNSDQEFDRLLSRSSAERKIPIRLSLRAVADGFELSANHTVIHIMAEHQQAKKSPRENIIRQLTKLGDTIFTCEEVDIPEDFNYFIPNSLLSDMRRTLVERMKSEKCEIRNDDIPTSPDFVYRSNQHSSFLISHYSYPYLYNISNRLSQQFYGTHELTAYELKGVLGPIMQCRHCIRYALGYCVKHGGKRPIWREPLSLVLGDGRRFRLEFDCQHCQMNVYAED
ncbi:MAG: U32 family peptidase [Prevotella sp.]|nr:U32 family peptidase [Prevotella sp.]